MKSSKFKIGDRVQYNHKFLKSTMADKDIADMKGFVKDIKHLFSSNTYIIQILWDGEKELKNSLESKLCKIGLDTTE